MKKEILEKYGLLIDEKMMKNKHWEVKTLGISKRNLTRKQIKWKKEKIKKGLKKEEIH